MFRWLMSKLCPSNCGEPRMIFVVKNVRETPAVVARTPQFYQWPLIGDVLMAVQLTSSQQCVLSIALTDKKGNPATSDGAPVWSVDNPNVLALAVAEDGMSCTVAAVGPLGTAKVSVVADADLGEGVKPLFGIADFEVTAGEATQIAITNSEPTEQAEPTPV